MDKKSQSSHVESNQHSRREILKWTGKLAAGSALAGVALPHVHAAEDNTIRLALIGCGGRGRGATGNACETTTGPVKLVAMADVRQDRLDISHKVLSKKYADQIDVPPERRFLGFDAYKKAIDCLGPGDVAILTTRAAFRPLQMEYAVSKGVNVFMEKSFATDPVGVRRVIKAAEAAEKKGLKIGAGAMCRHSANRQELIKRIRDGELGQIINLRACRMQDFGKLGRKREGENEIFWQLHSAYHLFWLSAGLWSEADIHQVDEMCWIKDAWPVSAKGVGGRVPNSIDCGQNLDSCAAEWTFADGTKANYVMRGLPKCQNEFGTYIHGSKCAAQFSGNIHVATTRIYKDQRMESDNIVWQAPREPISPYHVEWNVLLDAVRNNRPHNEGKRAAMAQATDIMGRAAVHMGRVITMDEVLASNFEWVPGGVDNFNENSPPPVQCDETGHYPSPVPGQWIEV